ncbi:MAG: FtsX-like permease family protein [Planctomycetes bacterium]|nr:FtsX-like permease family protein [Planctomycetota bacterium]
MLSLFRTLSLRYLSRRWFRAALVVASIMLGVATLVATQALSDTMAKATLAAGNPLAGTLDFIVANGEQLVDRDLATEIASIPGVKSVQPRIFGQAKVLIGKEKQAVLVLGIELSAAAPEADDLEGQFDFDPETRRMLDALAKPQGPERPDEKADPKLLKVYFDSNVLGNMPAILGKELDQIVKSDPDPVTLATLKFLKLDDNLKFFQVEKGPKKHQLVRVASIAPKQDGELAALGGYVIILGLKNAATVLGMPAGKVRRLDVALHPGTDAKQARRAIEKKLAGRAEVQTLDEQNQSLQSASVGMKTGFSMCGVAALIVGMFLVYNALSVSVAERRHEIGILLALGATRAQVWRLFAGEAFFLGVVGAALGIPLGRGFALIGLEPMQDAIGEIFATMNLQQVELSWELIALGFGVGIASAVVASLVPAVQAAYEKPAEAVRRVPKEPPVSHLLAHITATCALILAGLSMILVRDFIPRRWGTYGGLSLVMIGALLAAPLFAQVAARLLMPISRRLFPIEWRIAADNLIRAPGRTGMVIGALAAGVCLIVETAGIIHSNREAIRDWVQTSMVSDIIVTAGSPVGSGGQNEAMQESLRDELQKIDLVEEHGVVPNRQTFDIVYGSDRIGLIAIDVDRSLALESTRALKKDHLPFYEAMIREKNTVLISHNFEALHHVHRGDFITLKSPGGFVKLRVIGTVVDYTWNRGSIIMNRRDYIEHWQDTTVNYFEVYLKPGVEPKAAKAQIAAKLAQFDLHPLTRVELQERIDHMIERLYRIALGQEIVVVLIAALGVITALLISVLQRKREMGLLRAIGASRAQVVYLVLAEAFLMGVFGCILGVVFAIPLQWYALRVIFREETGYSFAVYIPWAATALIALAALVIATLAGVGPALYAVRERIPDAIAYE